MTFEILSQFYISVQRIGKFAEPCITSSQTVAKNYGVFVEPCITSSQTVTDKEEGRTRWKGIGVRYV